MPATHERAFRVRHYECGAHGHIHYATYLRYMQEAAMDASAAVGYDVFRYDAMERMWLIRETDISYLRPVVYGDTVIIKTWVADFRRVRSRRAYEMRHAETGDPVALAHTDWVYLDTTTLRPVTIPPEMITAFHPEGPPNKARRRTRFPTIPPLPPDVFKMRRRVEWRDLDQAQHVNNAMYMAYMAECEAQTGTVSDGFEARHYQVEYKQPAQLGDELEIVTWISDADQSAPTHHYTVTRVEDEALLAQAHASPITPSF